MTRWFVASLLLSGCTSEFAGGQATDALGLDPFGGNYNPSLAGCKIREVSQVDSGFGFDYEYDSRGRIKLSRYSNGMDVPSATETRWDGPCRVNDTLAAPNGELRIWDYACDPEGWPISGSQRTVIPSQETELEPIALSWQNTYEDGVLVHVESWDGYSTDLEWADGRVVRRDATNVNGVLDTNTYAYNDDGWVVEMTMNELVTTYAYDDRGRLVSAVQGETRLDWSYREDGDNSHAPGNGDRFPYLRTHDGNGITEGTGLHFDCP